MNGKSIPLALAIGLVLTNPAVSGPPQIDKLSQLGCQRGIPTELTISGSNLAVNPRLIAPFGFQLDAPAPSQGKSDASNWRLRLTVASNAALGLYPIRVQTDDGISNPFLWVVGQLTQIAEKEDNSTFETAQLIPEPPLVVEGEVAGNDVDFFRFHGKKGQLILVDAQCARIGSGIDPTIRLTTASANRTYVASADDSPGISTDARLTAVLPADADYVVEISDSRYQGAVRPVYRLVLGAVPMAEEIFPLGGRAGETVGVELRGGTLPGVRVAAVTLAALFGSELLPPRISGAVIGVDGSRNPVLDVESLAPLVVSHYPELREAVDPLEPAVPAMAPVVFNGRIDPAGDSDRFVLAATPGDRLRIRVVAAEFGSALDGVLQVLGSKGAVIANADDTVVPLPGRAGQQAQSLVYPDPSLEITVPGGTSEITLVIRDLENRGGVGFPYRIVVEPHQPDFQLVVDEPQVSVPRGGTAGLGVTVQRKGYSGPISVTVADPPSGLTVRPGTIPAGQNAGVLSLSAAAGASFPAAPVRLLGRGQGDHGTFEVLALKPVVYARQANMPMCTINQFGLFAAPALPLPASLETPSDPIEVPHGFAATIPVKVVRSRGADMAVAIATRPLPAGLTVASTTIADKATDGRVTVKAALGAPLGTMTIVLQAKGKLAGAERTIDAPAVTLAVVPPAAIALAAPALEVKAGTTAELKGSIIRKGTFDGPVTVRINGLPSGLKAEPVTIAGGAKDLVVKVAADAEAAATSASVQVALAFQVEKKDYPVPPKHLTVKVLPLK
jgi:hypothetical protein